jgi:outer membrane biosynthesis protein TonB
MADAEKIVHDVAERVRELVTEAEARAAEIVRDAEADAKRIRERAETEARERLDEVRTALADLEGKLKGSGSAEVDPGPVTVPEPSPEPVPEPAPAPVPEPTPDPVPEPTPDPVPEPTPPPDEGTPPTAGNGAKSGDAVAARLVAMNMALEGATRDEIERALASDYALDDAPGLIDDVLAKAGK